MAYFDDKYVRTMLDERGKWGLLLSLTAIAGLLHLLSDQPHLNWANVGPVVIGAFGSFFVLVVECYNKQAEAIAKVQTDIEKEKIRDLKWYKFILRIRFLGWLHILAPIVIGAFAMLMLFFGILTPPAANGAESIQSILGVGKSMTLDDTVKIWTLVFTGLGAAAAIIGAGGIICALKTFKFNTWLKAQEIYMDKEFSEARKTILSHFPFDKNNPPTFTAQNRDDALLVCRKMDELAHLKSYVGEEKIIEVWGIPMGKSWMILKKTVVKDERNKDQGKKWNAFQRLAEKAIKKYNLEELNKTLVS